LESTRQEAAAAGLLQDDRPNFEPKHRVRAHEVAAMVEVFCSERAGFGTRADLRVGGMSAAGSAV
jgi:hypothetical protein